MPVAVYPLTGASPEAVRTWWKGDLQHALHNGAAATAFSPLARQVQVVPAPGGGQLLVVHFGSHTDTAQGGKDLHRFWGEHGVGQLGAPVVVSDENWAANPDAVMVWKQHG
jgi:hypothetical protein